MTKNVETKAICAKCKFVYRRYVEYYVLAGYECDHSTNSTSHQNCITGHFDIRRKEKCFNLNINGNCQNYIYLHIGVKTRSAVQVV